jgi:hypothetical protein
MSMDIKVLGPGCPKCKEVEKLAMDAVRNPAWRPMWKRSRT